MGRKYRIKITRKPGVFDPEGETILKQLWELGYSNVTNLRVGRWYEVEIDGGPEEAGRIAKGIASQIFTNPVVDDCEVTKLEGE